MPIWAWILIAVLLVLVLTPFVVGRFLSTRFSATTTILLRQSPEAIWDAISDYEAFPVSGRMRKATTRLDPINGLPVLREDIGSTRIRVTTIESLPPHRIVRQLADEVVPMTSLNEYDIEQTPNGARLQIASVGTIENGAWQAPFIRFMIHVFGGIKCSQKQYVTAIARHFDETPTFQQ